MSPIISEVVAAEWLHRHGVAPHDSDLPGGSGGSFGSYTGSDHDTMSPVTGFVDQGSYISAPATEHDGGNGHSTGVFRQQGVTWVLAGRYRKTRIRMSGRTISFVIGFPFPVSNRVAFLQSFPPWLIIAGHCDVGEDGVASDHVESILVGFWISARHYAEITCFRI